MQADLKYLPPNFGKLIARQLKCHPNTVYHVKAQIEANNKATLTSKLQIKILRKLKQHIDEAKKAHELLQAS